MKAQIKNLLARAGRRSRFFRLLIFGLSAFGLAGCLTADDQHAVSDLTVHEWGTFTAVAGPDGQAVEWAPFTGSTDLPGFVEHLADANFKGGLRGRIRMETPVLYFYSPRDVSLSVKVAFSKGVITEWYPGATRVQPSGPLRNVNLTQTDGSITWNSVTVSPDTTGDFPREVSWNRYYVARGTSSAPLCVKTSARDQQEKFLFYRGVSASGLPLSANLNPEGEIVVKNLSRQQIPSIILFERRGERVGFRLAGELTGERILNPPVLNGSVDSLCGDLEGILVGQGLYPDEAHAMVETWRDSWFEEGSRLIYIVPRGFIDHVLPLTINPSPGQTVRVFVGRLEMVTPATARAVETAIVSGDERALSKYGRFLEPILKTVRAQHPELVKNAKAAGR
jgi:hypothetical protein